MQPMEKVLKEKPIKAPFQRKPDNGAYVNNAYDMAVISTQTTDSGTPETVEETVSKCKIINEPITGITSRM